MPPVRSGAATGAEGPAGECAEVDMATTLSPAPGRVVLWKGTKNVNDFCCEVTHKSHNGSFHRVKDQVDEGPGDALSG